MPPKAFSHIDETQFHPEIVLISLHADPVSPAGIGEGGGTHSYLRELLNLLAKLAIPHLLLTRWANTDAVEEEHVSSCGRVVRLDIGIRGKMDKRFLDDYHQTTVQRIEEKLSRYSSPKLLHSIYWNSGRAAVDIAHRLKIPFVHTVISNGSRRLKAGYCDQPIQRQEVENQVFHAAKRIFCICSQERDDLISFYGVAPEKISVVGRPVARPFLIPCRNGHGKPRVLSATNALRAFDEL